MFAMTFGPFQIAFLLLFGALLFGHRLPEVSRSLAKALRDFRSALNGIEDDVTVTAPTAPALAAPRPPRRVSAALPHFDGADASPSA